MKLIGAGLPRTGTLSQKIALEMLGLAPCYHMVNVLGELDETERWRKVLHKELAIDEVLGDFEATVDWPGSFFTKELIEVYPDAKVLLSVRRGDSWARSMRDTIWGVLYGDMFLRHISDARRDIDPNWDSYMSLMDQMWNASGLMEDESTTAEYMSDAMERYNEEIKQIVPAERLLVWSVADGWGPLCEFLEVPVPDQPFPAVNDSKQFSDRIVDGALLAIQRYRAEDADQEPLPAAT
jgi:Sulfotransferase domain